MISKKHKTIFGILFSIVLLLLLSEIVIDKVFPGSTGKPAVSKTEVDTVFTNTLMNFGFRKDWYNLKGGSYYVSLPQDLPAELIMLDLVEHFKDKDFNITSKELLKGSHSQMHIHSGNEDVLTVEFSYDPEKKRHTSAISFLLLNPGELNKDEEYELFNSQEKYSLALYPSKENRVTAGEMIASGKQYAVMINNDIDELEYRLDDKFSNKKLVITIQTIISHFNSAVFYVIDNYHSGISVRVLSILQKELRKRNLRYSYLQDFKFISNIADGYQLEKIFNQGAENSQVYIMEAGEYLRLKDEMKYLRKRGFRIVPL